MYRVLPAVSGSIKPRPCPDTSIEAALVAAELEGCGIDIDTESAFFQLDCLFRILCQVQLFDVDDGPRHVADTKHQSLLKTTIAARIA